MKHNLLYSASLQMHPPRISICLNNVIINVNTSFYCFDRLSSAAILFEHSEAYGGISHLLSFPKLEKT